MREHELRMMRTAMRNATKEFIKFDMKWNELNDALNVKLDAEGVMDIVQREKVKSVNIELAGYMSAAKWWRDKATMLASVLRAEVILKKELMS